MRFAVDTGGTFTDLIVEEDAGQLRMFKAPTTPADPIKGTLDALQLAADAFGTSLAGLLARGETFIYATTHAINAMITGNTARTAFLTTAGHPDILVMREGGRVEPFNFTVPFPPPYVPRALTFEVPERILADGSVREPLDEAAVAMIIERMKDLKVEAVGVCLLWSIVNPYHEKRVGALLDKLLPGVQYTLSHLLNPTLREYRRASSTVIDASLKPMMAAYMESLEARVRSAGFAGRVLAVTSQGGVIDGAEAAHAPIHLINSGPSMAPVSGRYFAAEDEGSTSAIVADTGGTTYDVSLVRHGRIPWTRETWIGGAVRGHMTGFPSVDVKSVGAGGGSIAWVDSCGMLHVGPGSAGAVPGPAAYGRGGTLATVTDAALALGYLDPDFFLGGSMSLDPASARRAIEEHVATPLRLPVEDAAVAVLTIATENMVQAIIDITVNQGIDPRESVLIGGGGAAGLNSVLIARRLGSKRLLIPQVGAALSAAGAIMSDLTAQYQAPFFTRSDAFDFAGAAKVIAELEARAKNFIIDQGKGSAAHTVRFFAEARYPEQVWEIEVEVAKPHFSSLADVRTLEAAFHAAHQEIFAMHDVGAPIEIVGWSVSVACRIRTAEGATLVADAGRAPIRGKRKAYFTGIGACEAEVRRFEAIQPGEKIAGPAIIESSFTSVVINPGATASRRASGSLSIEPGR